MTSRAEFPRPEFERQNWLSLNGSWDFALFPEGTKETEGVYDSVINVPFSWAAPLSGIAKNVPGIGKYRKKVSFEAEGRVFLCVGGADYQTDISVNGKHVCSHRGAYNAFECDVTAVWQKGENTIEIRCEDFRRETQTYGKQGYGDIQGIWQSVWLESRPENYIKDFRFITKCTGDVLCTVNCAAPEGAIVTAKFGGKEFSGSVKNGAATIAMRFEEPRLWSTDDPYLYEGTLTLSGGDEIKTYFGIREIGQTTLPGKDYPVITLNGKPIYINGTLDQAFNPEGHFTYPSEEAIKREIWRLKRLGLNMARIHIKAEEPRKLYWLDKMGILVMEDMPCFWSEPCEEAREAYEEMWPEVLRRDFNHPCIFAWVLFNETWGLFNKEDGNRKYLPETQEWVRSVYKRAKENDPTRIVEDNSACNYDHIETDIDTWHFYINGYERVRQHLIEADRKVFAGSDFNYIGENRQTDIPWMNSECGMVWGVKESAGDSDIAWQYHYMLNEFRLHQKLCGFVFTEFHDVVNEFNGYYRIDDKDKDFGYQDLCRGMTLKDMHAQDFLALDCPPCRTVSAGDAISVPAVLSSFTDAHQKDGLTASWELWHDSIDGRVFDGCGTIDIPAFGYGTTNAENIDLVMPNENAVAVLSVWLKDKNGNIISRNFTTFDVRASKNESLIGIPFDSCKCEGFAPVWSAMQGDKLCLGGEGTVTFEADIPEGVSFAEIVMEASAKRIITKDLGGKHDSDLDGAFMRGYRVDRGSFKNSYFMTDEDAAPTEIIVYAEGVEIAHKLLVTDPADAKGILSWHAQPTYDWLDEAGSYGELLVIPVSSRVLRAGKMQFTIKVIGKGGLALYGRNCGRYAVAPSIRVR